MTGRRWGSVLQSGLRICRPNLWIGLAVLCAFSHAARAACTLTFTGLSFGTYTGTLLPGVNQGTVNCANGTAYYIGLNAGLGAGATTTTRKMTGVSGATLSYQIFQNTTRTVNWGDNEGVDTVSGTGNGTNQIYYAYSQIQAGQYVAPGTYTDVISSATTSFTVTAIVQPTCLISATAMNFGTYANAVLQSTSTISVTCTNTTPYNIGLNAGTASGATVTTRRMTGPGSATLSYDLYRDSGYSLNWGMTVGTDTVAATATGSSQGFTVYGKIPAGQMVSPGSYNDTIIATVTY